MNKFELKAAAARLLYENNRDSADYDMLVDYIDNSVPVSSEMSSSDAVAKAKDGMFLTSIIAQICDYAVAHHISPDDTIKTISDNLARVLEISTFEGWKKSSQRVHYVSCSEVITMADDVRLIDAGKLIGYLHEKTFIDGDDRSMVYKAIEEQPTVEAEPVNGWISVKDRLPENDGLYIVCKTVRGHRISFEAHWKGNEWLSVVKNNQLDYITHWQPLPEPPKEE